MSADFKSIKSPLQMAGFYLAWIETALAASLWPLKGHDTLLMILMSAVVGIAIIFALGVVFVLVYLTRYNPYWLYNPSDFDPGVQDELFEHSHSFSAARSRGGVASVRKGVSPGGEVKGDA